MAGLDQVGYKDVNPFYHHINWLFEKEAEAKWKYNDISYQSSQAPRIQQLIHLEDWYMTLETLYHRVLGMFTDEDNQSVEKIITEIDTITRGDNFATCNLTDAQMIEIRNKCRELSKLLNALMWRHKIHVDVKIARVGKRIW